MADSGGGGGAGSPPDVLWTFPGNITGDQNANIYTYTAERALSFIGFSGSLNVAPTGQSIQVQWLKNGVVVFTLVIPVGQVFQFTAFAISLNPRDTLQPQLLQAGTIQPGITLLLKARGS